MKLLRLDEEAIANGFTLNVTLGSRITVGRKVHYQFSEDQRPEAYKTTTMQVLLPFPDVSARHAEIEYGSNQCIVTDRSRNGTSLNGERITVRQAVNDGDLLSFAGYQLRLHLTDPFDQSNHRADSPEPVEIDKHMSGLVKQALAADRAMWSNAQKKSYKCFVCLNKVPPSYTACSNCMRLVDGYGPEPGKEIHHGLKLLRAGLRWDRLLYEAARPDSSESYLVEMRPLHARDLPLEFLLNADCQLLQLSHPNMVRLFTWFEFPYPGWQFGNFYVRVMENFKAVNAKTVLSKSGPFPWRSAVSIIIEALKPIIYALEQGYTVLADSFQTGQLWLVDLGDGKYGVKVDGHQKSFRGCFSQEGQLEESVEFWNDLRFRGGGEDSSADISQLYIVRVVSTLYELIAGKCPPKRREPSDFQQPPDMVPIADPQLAALIMDCLGEPQQAPRTLYVLRERLSQIYLASSGHTHEGTST